MIQSTLRLYFLPIKQQQKAITPTKFSMKNDLKNFICTKKQKMKLRSFSRMTKIRADILSKLIGYPKVKLPIKSL